MSQRATAMHRKQQGAAAAGRPQGVAAAGRLGGASAPTPPYTDLFKACGVDTWPRGDFQKAGDASIAVVRMLCGCCSCRCWACVW